MIDFESKQIKRFVICLTGMPGAGKSTVATSLKEAGYTILTMGDAVREEARRQNLQPTSANLGSLMLRLRQELGPGAIAFLVIKKLAMQQEEKEDNEKRKELDYERFNFSKTKSDPLDQNKRIGFDGGNDSSNNDIIRTVKENEGKKYPPIVIDGIRSIEEVEVLKKIGPVKLLAIHASTKTRFDHLRTRGRSDDPSSENDFIVRDKRELTVGISEAIAMADETISNNNLTKAELKEQAIKIIQKWINE